MFGVDFSENMLKLAKKGAGARGLDVNLVEADVHHLPFRDECFDNILFVASLHNTKQREQVLEEVRRVLKLGGRCLITIWNRWQPRFFFKKKELFVPWKKGNGVYMRYYYLFSKNELRETLESAGFRIVKIFGSKDRVLKLFPRNIVAIIVK